MARTTTTAGTYKGIKAALLFELQPKEAEELNTYTAFRTCLKNFNMAEVAYFASDKDMDLERALEDAEDALNVAVRRHTVEARCLALKTAREAATAAAAALKNLKLKFAYKQFTEKMVVAYSKASKKALADWKAGDNDRQTFRERVGELKSAMVRSDVAERRFKDAMVLSPGISLRELLDDNDDGEMRVIEALSDARSENAKEEARYWG